MYQCLASLETVGEMFLVEGKGQICDVLGVDFPGAFGVVGQVDNFVAFVEKDLGYVSSGKRVGSGDSNLHN